MKYFFLIVVLVFSCVNTLAQDTIEVKSRPKKFKSKSAPSSLGSSSEKLAKSIEEEVSSDKIASDYYAVARVLIKKGDYIKAEPYLKKAIVQLLGDKGNKNLPLYYRELARLQEQLKKDKEAASSYDLAATYSYDLTQRQINLNDAARLRQAPSPEKEIDYLKKNEVILNNSGNAAERVSNYQQIAEVSRKQNKPDEAIKSYTDALKVLDSTGDESNRIRSDLAEVLVEKKQFDKAILIQKEVVQQATAADGIENQVQQMRKLSGYYFQGNRVAEGINTLKDAYRLSIEKGNVKEARASVEALTGYYKKAGKDKEALLLHSHFLLQLDSLIAKDSSLVDARQFQFSEDKIARLEKEKELKDELIRRKNTNNTILIISVVLLLILMAAIVKALYSIKKRNKQIALQSLRREMNPHFLFNSLNSVNQFIASNNEREANKYLTSYANLMRRTMENSNKDDVSLATEVEQITRYLELEKLRFSDKFDFEIYTDPNLDQETIQVPNMLIQPNLENAIWHGLRYRESKGLLKISFISEGGLTKVSIDDNGIGLKESQLIKTKNQKMYESRGLKNVEERIALLNEIGKRNIQIEIKEKTLPETGVEVTISW